MKIYIYAVSDDLDEIMVPVAGSIGQWLAQDDNKVEAILVNKPEAEVVGIHLQLKKTLHLKEPLNSLNRIAKQHKCDFVLGLLPESNEGTVPEAEEDREDICFFGHEEGKPDMFEVACYIGLEK
jgi:hypothetical protein